LYLFGQRLLVYGGMTYVAQVSEKEKYILGEIGCGIKSKSERRSQV